MRPNSHCDASEPDEAMHLRRWRFEQLVQVGYAPPDALEIARDPGIDLDFARRLVQRFGCPPEVAAKILT